MSSAAPQAGAFIRREAKRLHRAATSDSPALALPVLRRILQAGVVRNLSLPRLHKARAGIRRKHILRMLAVEAGYASWEAFVPHLQDAEAARAGIFASARLASSQLNHWFASREEAERHVAVSGGEWLRIGRDYVVPGG